MPVHKFDPNDTSLPALQRRFGQAFLDGRHPLVAKRFPVALATDPFDYVPVASTVEVEKGGIRFSLGTINGVELLGQQLAARVDYECLMAAGGTPLPAVAQDASDTTFVFADATLGPGLFKIVIGPARGFYRFGGKGPDIAVRPLDDGYEIECVAGGQAIVSKVNHGNVAHV